MPRDAKMMKLMDSNASVACGEGLAGFKTMDPKGDVADLASTRPVWEHYRKGELMTTKLHNDKYCNHSRKQVMASVSTYQTFQNARITSMDKMNQIREKEKMEGFLSRADRVAELRKTNPNATVADINNATRNPMNQAGETDSIATSESSQFRFMGDANEQKGLDPTKDGPRVAAAYEKLGKLIATPLVQNAVLSATKERQGSKYERFGGGWGNSEKRWNFKRFSKEDPWQWAQPDGETPDAPASSGEEA